eukprot:TRINITY_DN3182_c0_g1_i1.p2 TRINITY_DN3182_c0_g1~~TRINITY_DN3182_c0_g1_i1.p2  ORF type:complete len:181 (+),score=40.69 TRINITY_DN3182_c0_g1_i1:831-1373(+)
MSNILPIPMTKNAKPPKQPAPKASISSQIATELHVKARSEAASEMKHADPTFDLDQRGESCWIYPGADGKYEVQFVAKEISTPLTRVTEDNREFEDLLAEFPSAEKRNSAVKPPVFPKESFAKKTKPNKPHSYVSNIATIMMNSKIMGSPRLEQGLLSQASNLGKLHFPHEIFRSSPTKS